MRLIASFRLVVRFTGKYKKYIWGIGKLRIISQSAKGLMGWLENERIVSKMRMRQGGRKGMRRKAI